MGLYTGGVIIEQSMGQGLGIVGTSVKNLFWGIVYVQNIFKGGSETQKIPANRSEQIKSYSRSEGMSSEHI